VFDIIKQARNFLLDAIKGVRSPVRRVDARPQPLDMGEDSLKAGFCFGLHGYTSVKSFSRTAAVTALPSPMTARSPLSWITE